MNLLAGVGECGCGVCRKEADKTVRAPKRQGQGEQPFHFLTRFLSLQNPTSNISSWAFYYQLIIHTEPQATGASLSFLFLSVFPRKISTTYLPMETYEATNILLSKIKNIDPENASKIMGYILIQDFADKDLFSLASASETLLQNVVAKAKTHLGLSTNALSTLSAPSSPLPLNPISRPSYNHNPFSQSSAKANPFVDFTKNPSPHSWPASILTNNSTAASISPKSSPFLSYDNIRAGFALVPPFSQNGGNGGGDASSNSTDLFNEHQLDEYFSFLDDFSPKNEEFVDPRFQLDGLTMNNVDSQLHRRRFSESDACFGIEDGGFGIGHRPCMYFARGFCKNGDSCKFVHGGFDGDNIPEVSGGSVIGGSLREMNGLYLQQHEEMLRIKAAQQQQRLAYSKYMNFLLQQESDPQRYFEITHFTF